jgi:hypothetical protein
MHAKGSVRILMLPFFIVVYSENTNIQRCQTVLQISYKSQYDI